MIVHIVFWRLVDNPPNGKTKQDNALEIKRRFEALRGVIPGLMRCEIGIDVSRVSGKGKTNEGVDAVGRGEAVAAHAVALLTSV